MWHIVTYFFWGFYRLPLSSQNKFKVSQKKTRKKRDGNWDPRQFVRKLWMNRQIDADLSVYQKQKAFFALFIFK